MVVQMDYSDVESNNCVKSIDDNASDSDSSSSNKCDSDRNSPTNISEDILFVDVFLNSYDDDDVFCTTTEVGNSPRQDSLTDEYVIKCIELYVFSVLDL